MDGTYEDFRPEREDWNIYKLTDGTVIKLRQLVTKVRRDKSAGNGSSMPNLSVDVSNLLLAVFPPATLMGPPSGRQYAMDELGASVIDGPLASEILREPENEYVTKTGARILLKLTGPSFARTDKFTNTGEPIYIVNNPQVAIQVIGRNREHRAQ
jgi:hypothetical protein